MSKKSKKNRPICPYCGVRSEFIQSSAELYRGRDYGPMYICRPCDARVGVYKGTRKPLGRLANAELRVWKMKAHAAFDGHWRDNPQRDRHAAYYALCHVLNMDRRDCHIGMFDVEECKLVIEACEYGLVFDAMQQKQLDDAIDEMEHASPYDSGLVDEDFGDR